MLAYHGTDYTFKTFKPGIIFFTKDADVAKGYGRNVKKVSLQMDMPLTFDFIGGSTYFFDGKWRTPSALAQRIFEIREDCLKRYYLDEMLEEELIEHGYEPGVVGEIDGLILKNIADVADMSLPNTITDHYVVFSQKQISKVNPMRKNGEFSKVKLSDGNIVNMKEDQRYTWDKRRKFTWVVVEYSGNDGNPYRKAFNFERSISLTDIKALIPKSGTNEELTKIAKTPFYEKVKNNPEETIFERTEKRKAQGKALANSPERKKWIEANLHRMQSGTFARNMIKALELHSYQNTVEDWQRYFETKYAQSLKIKRTRKNPSTNNFSTNWDKGDKIANEKFPVPRYSGMGMPSMGDATNRFITRWVYIIKQGNNESDRFISNFESEISRRDNKTVKEIAKLCNVKSSGTMDSIRKAIIEKATIKSSPKKNPLDTTTAIILTHTKVTSDQDHVAASQSAANYLKTVNYTPKDLYEVIDNRGLALKSKNANALKNLYANLKKISVKSNPAKLINQKDYKFYVIGLNPQNINKIHSGWEYKEDALDALEETEISGRKVLQVRGLKALGLEPKVNSDWGPWGKINPRKRSCQGDPIRIFVTTQNSNKDYFYIGDVKNKVNFLPVDDFTIGKIPLSKIKVFSSFKKAEVKANELVQLPNIKKATCISDYEFKKYLNPLA
jgi:hypothetical protein